MGRESKRHHVFISHHHADDQHVDNLTDMLKRRGYDVRNSSIRAKPANQARLDKGLVRPEVIQRLLRIKIAWAGTAIVLIGKETHSRDWVNWEIEQAVKKGKNIVGVYARGMTDATVPPALEKYACNIVGWNTDAIMAAVAGKAIPFQNPDGTPRVPVHMGASTIC